MEYKDRQEWLRKDPNQEDPDPCYVWNGEKIPLKPRISDEDGNPIWHVECHIDEIDVAFDSESSSKKPLSFTLLSFYTQ